MKLETLGKAEASTPHPNAWLVKITEQLQAFSVAIPVAADLMKGLAKDDAIVGFIESAGRIITIFFARVYRIGSSVQSTTLYFDSVVAVEPAKDVTSLGIQEPSGIIERVDWKTFATALKAATGKGFADLKPLEGDTTVEQDYLRRLLRTAVTDDLHGPANGPHEEVVGMSVRDRYLVGKLAPKNSQIEDDQNEDLQKEGEDEEEPELDASKSLTLAPSSIGFTFCIDGDATEFEIDASWGRYVRGESETLVSPKTGKPRRAWKRAPSGGLRRIPIVDGAIKPFAPDPEQALVVVHGTIRPPLPTGERLITLFLVNEQEKPEENQDSCWLFQPRLAVRGIDEKPVLRRRPLLESASNDPELEALEMVYRDRVEFAVGHGISVHATISPESPGKASRVETVVIPEYELPVTETPGSDPADRPAMRALVAGGNLDMDRLAEKTRPKLLSVLRGLAADYSKWIEEESARISSELSGRESSGRAAMDTCRQISRRLDAGVECLESDDNALEAFRFANRAMARQRIHSLYALSRRRGRAESLAEFDVPKNRSWRPFQIAFLLLSLPALANPAHSDRTESMDANADLLWFPTGGGKTEAYLGLAAFAMTIRRLQGKVDGLDGTRGLAVIMRYTLRLLTIQQFQRATTLLCAMETLRTTTPEDSRMWGKEPFTLGLWVGNKVTPGTTEQSHAAIEAARNGQRVVGATPAQLTFCPWCGSEISVGRDIHVDRTVGRTAICCGDKLQQCEFSEGKRKTGLPVVVVDEEIYHRPPSMLIGTVDKFAMMTWRGQTRTLFGRAEIECERHGLLWPGGDCAGRHNARNGMPSTVPKPVVRLRPPDLIIQDEFHLISGPLGTMVALYESAIDELCTWNYQGKAVRPKIIASTATVRKANEQVRNVFLRNVAVFPPNGLHIGDNFFSVQRPTSNKPGRLYIGICAPGSSRPAVLIRLYVALLTAAQELFNRFGSAADPYMTLVGYFNSLRELGGMRRLSEDDVKTRSFRVQRSAVDRPGLAQRDPRVVEELTSRVSNRDIPKKLDQLELQHKSAWIRGETRAIDIVLATNMLSVGVDVGRLGLMAMNGQPKTTAEYIQATSRVGRAFPGLVCTVLTWSRPRDLSHYETFEHYHATFYKHVEAQSVTPFAARAMDRGLTGTFVSLTRLLDETLNPNLGAGELRDSGSPTVKRARELLVARAWKVSRSSDTNRKCDKMLASLIDTWVTEASQKGRDLGYETERGQGTVASLLKKPSLLRWDQLTAPMSMREVEPGVNLVMDTSMLKESALWTAQKVASEDTPQ